MLQVKLLNDAHSRALNIVHSCVTPYGYRASGLAAGYPQVWARDSAITFLGAAASGDESLFAAGRAALATLGKFQSSRGLIPLNVNPDTGYVSTENAGAVDSNLWFILGHYLHYQYTGDLAFLQQHWPTIDQAMRWLDFQDMNECGLLEIPEAGDWMDLLAVRYNVLYDNVLYYAAKLAHAELARLLPPGTPVYSGAWTPLASTVGSTCSCGSTAAGWPSTSPNTWRSSSASGWNGSCSITTWAPSPAAPITCPGWPSANTATGATAWATCWRSSPAWPTDTAREHILRFMHQVGMAEPYPTKAIYPPIFPGESNWRDYYRSRNLNLPHQYHNGGIWPMIGGFHVAALVRHGWQHQAEQMLISLAEANRQGTVYDWTFNEWLHGSSGHPMGYEQQAWSAAMYLYAENAVRTGKLPLFDELLAAKPAAAVAAEDNAYHVAGGGGPA